MNIIETLMKFAAIGTGGVIATRAIFSHLKFRYQLLREKGE